MKLKEKINKTIEENDALSFMKGLWDNKRTRSSFWLIIYFIFFFVIISSMRGAYQEQPINTDNPNSTLNISDSLAKIDDYSYEILLNNKSLLVGNVKDNTNRFNYNEKNYIIVADSIYLEKDLNLTKVDLTKEKDLFVPINKIMLDDIEDYIEGIDSVQGEGYIQYSINASKIFEETDEKIIIKFYGKNEIDKIELDFIDYIKSENYEYENYVLTIKLGDENNA